MKYAKVITGDVIFKESEDYSDVEEIKGNLYVRGAAAGAFPKLTTNGGDLYAYGAAAGTFPKLTKNGGNLDAHGAEDGAFPKLATNGGNLYAERAAAGAFPKLTTNGGDLYAYGAAAGAFPKLATQNCGDAKAMKNVTAAFRRSGFVRFDRILSFIRSTKIITGGLKIHHIVVVGKAKSSFCVETCDGTFSHGDTIKQAKESLIYKIGERDKSAYEKWTIDTVVTKRQAIESYRIITGACEAGTRHFVESVGKTKEKYSVREVIKLTEWQYGHDSYKSFFAR